jgi:hypothetical protein
VRGFDAEPEWPSAGAAQKGSFPAARAADEFAGDEGTNSKAPGRESLAVLPGEHPDALADDLAVIAREVGIVQLIIGLLGTAKHEPVSLVKNEGAIRIGAGNDKELQTHGLTSTEDRRMFMHLGPFYWWKVTR